MNITEQIVNAVNIANDLRLHFGIEPIDDLPKGIPNIAEHCILARAFNFECRICPIRTDKSGKWKARFYGHDQEAAKFAALVGATVTRIDTEVGSILQTPTINEVIIPDEIAEIARQFDAGRLPEYEEEGDL